MTNSQKPRVSAVILNFNRKNDVKEAVNSLYSQGYPNLEIIVVDNGSSDGSAEMIKKDLPMVDLIMLPKNIGIEGFNVGMRKACGEYIAVMDNDVVLGKDWLDKAIGAFAKEDNLGAFVGRVINYYTGRDMGFWIYGLSGEWIQKEFYTTTFYGCSAVIRKSALDTTGYYPADYFLYWNEGPLGAKIVNAGYMIKYSPSLISYHKQAVTQRPAGTYYYYLWRNAYWYYWQYYPRDLAIRFSLLHFIFSWRSLICRYPLRSLKLLVTFIQANLAAFKELPAILKKRAPIKDGDVLKPIHIGMATKKFVT